MYALLKREVLIAVRAGGGVGLGLAFFLIFVLISAIGIGRDTELLAATAPGVLWTGALLATLLSLDRLFQADFEDGSLEALMLSPLPIEGIIATKILAHWLTTGLPLVILSPVMAIMLQLPASSFDLMIVSLSVGTISLSAIGAIGAAITLGIRRGGLLLSLLVMPLFVPTLIFGVRVLQDETNNLSATTPLLLLTGLTLFSLVLSPLAASYSLKVNLR